MWRRRGDRCRGAAPGPPRPAGRAGARGRARRRDRPQARHRAPAGAGGWRRGSASRRRWPCWPARGRGCGWRGPA
ncbi:MAG: hypothetical protein ACK55Z_32575, partial [bacterium]